MAERAQERELEDELRKLDQKFKKWKKGKIDAFTLNHKIHKYHNGASRDLYKKYRDEELLDLVVGKAIASGILKEEEVEEDLLKILEVLIERF